MAKFLAYKRTTRQVVTVDTINAVVADLGNVIATGDTTNAFPNRSENLVCAFRSDYYFLYRSSTNEIHLSKFDIATTTWADVVGFPPMTTATGLLTPLCLHVVQDRLVAIAELSLSTASDGLLARRSNQDDGSVWSASLPVLYSSQPLESRAGSSIVWRNAVWVTTSEGIIFYDPAADLFGTAFDQGSNSLIVGQKANFGSFAFFENDLYYVLPTDLVAGAPSIYLLDALWSIATPTPTFARLILVIPGVGAITLNNDSGNYSLFVNKANVLSLLYSGTVESKVVTITKSGASFEVTDITNSSMPSSISGEPSLGFSLYADDRRSTNEQHTIIVRFRPNIPVSVNLLLWDGVTAMVETGVLDASGAGLDLMTSDSSRGDFRTYTANEPSAYIDDTSQPFPGRVRLDYTISDELSRPMDVLPEFSIDGQIWTLMTQGDGDSGSTGLTSTPTGSAYFFFWDAFADLDGDHDNVEIRVVARIAGV